MTTPATSQGVRCRLVAAESRGVMQQTGGAHHRSPVTSDGHLLALLAAFQQMFAMARLMDAHDVVEDGLAAIYPAFVRS